MKSIAIRAKCCFHFVSIEGLFGVNSLQHARAEKNRKRSMLTHRDISWTFCFYLGSPSNLK